MARCEVVAEIGVNHNGSVDEAMRLIDVAAAAGCDAVKVQVRTPELAVPREQWDEIRDTPFGPMTKLAYRERMELGDKDLIALRDHARKRGLLLFGSAWDVDSLRRLTWLHIDTIKIPSARLHDTHLIRLAVKMYRRVIVSTGLHPLEDVDEAARLLRPGVDVLLHCVGCYPCATEDLALGTMDFYRDRYPGLAVGYSGHETGVATTVAAAALGACMAERHITMDRAQKGSDHAASLEPAGLQRLVRDIRAVESASGVRPSWPLPCEMQHAERLRS